MKYYNGLKQPGCLPDVLLTRRSPLDRVTFSLPAYVSLPGFVLRRKDKKMNLVNSSYIRERQSFDLTYMYQSSKLGFIPRLCCFMFSAGLFGSKSQNQTSFSR